ncbi:MAG: SRPBCC family protein [Acidimicrobiales bacterium]
MTDVTAEQTIAAPAADVWAVLGDEFDRLHEWFDGASDTELETVPPIGMGAVRIVKNGPVKIREEVVTWDPPHRLSYSIEGLGPGASDIRSDWVLHARPDGSTVAQVKTSWDMRGGALGKVFRPLYAQLLARAGDKLTTGLKAAVETGG